MFWPRIKLLIVKFIVLSTALFGYQEAAKQQLEPIEQFYQRCAKTFEVDFCANSGKCYIVDTLAVCQCLHGFMGERCYQKYSVTEDVPRGYSTENVGESDLVVTELVPHIGAAAIVLLVVLVVLVVVIVVIGTIFLYVTTIVNRMIQNLTP